MPDIDIDFADRNLALNILEHRTAKLEDDKKHNTGIYFTEIPHNPVDNVSTLSYTDAEARGYFKLDFLNVNIYKDVRDEAHLKTLMNTEPMWELLLEEEFVNQLFHVNGHTEILKKLKPTNIEQLAATLAIIRPAKRYLLNKNWKEILENVWTVPDDGSYYFKKSHAVSYAVAVVVHMNLICEKLKNETNN